MRCALVNALLIDGNGREPLDSATILINGDGRLEAVGKDVHIPNGVPVIDVGGRTVMPGLIDCHVHLFLQIGKSMQEESLTPLSYRVLESAVRAKETLDAGVTTIRDAGRTPRGFKMAAERGLIVSPRLKISVAILSQTGGHSDPFLPSGIMRPNALMDYEAEWPHRIADGVDGVRKATRQMLRAGADFIKICTTGGVLSPEDEPWHTQYTKEEIEAAVFEAEARGKYVAAHAQGAVGIKRAIESGVRTIEHGIYLDEEAADQMVSTETYLVPTLHAPQGILKAEAAQPGSVLPQAFRKAQEVIEIHKASVKLAVDKGVKIAMGTDAGVGLHGTNAEELSYLVEFGGMSPMDALVAATKTAAELNRMEQDIGTLEPGKQADLLVIDGDPLYDITILQDKDRLSGIMIGGRWHKPIDSA